MNQFAKIFNFELKYYLKNKIFIGVTLLTVLLMAVMMFLPRIISIFKSEDGGEATSADMPVMLVKTELEDYSKILTEKFEQGFKNYKVQSTGEDLDSIKNKITTGEIECAFVITGTDSYIYYVNNLSLHDENTDTADEILKNIYQINAMTGVGMTAEQAHQVLSVNIRKGVENLGKNQIQNYFYTYIMIFALYMVILLYGQMVATNVATEKSSRAMELLITSANPTSMMFGKVLASCLAGFLQIAVVFGSAILFYSINKQHWGENPIVTSIFDMPLSLLGFMLIFFVLGFLIYGFMFGAVGSTVSKLEDINTAVMPITLLFIAGFLVVTTALPSGEVNNSLMKICSFVPFTSSMAMFTRIAMSTVPWYEIVISIAILIGSVIGVGVISAKIYRVGVLLYGVRPKITTIIKAVWKA